MKKITNAVLILTCAAIIGFSLSYKAAGSQYSEPTQNGWPSGKDGHQCQYPACPYKCQHAFKIDTAEVDIGSDTYYMDSLHFTHPDWEDYQLQDSAIILNTQLKKIK